MFVFVGFGGCALVFGVCCLICYCSPGVCVWVFVAVHLCMMFCVWGCGACGLDVPWVAWFS